MADDQARLDVIIRPRHWPLRYLGVVLAALCLMLRLPTPKVAIWLMYRITTPGKGKR